VPGTDLPTTWEEWAALVRAALEPGAPIPPDQLLLVRDLEGRFVRRMEPPEGVIVRPGAVLLLLYPGSADLYLPLTVRSDQLPNHRGEVSLPGGATDPEDDGPVATALRECWEELGVTPDSLEVWGSLSPIYIPPSNFRITPVVAFARQQPAFNPNSGEVSAVLTVGLRELLDPRRVLVEQWTLRGAEVRVPFFSITSHKVWGATALILSEFVARLRRALQEPTAAPPMPSVGAG
jgi:8-oxo-dGTP pyrophosphatase MutT (NUDIX family)